MSDVKVRNYANREEILYLSDYDYIGIPVSVDADQVTANADGEKIVEALTPVGGVNNSTLKDNAEKVEPKLDAPVAATTTLDMTNDNADIVFTTVEKGAAGNNIQVQTKDPGTSDANLSVEVQGDTVVVNLATDGSSNITSTAQEVVDAVNAHLLAQDLVEAANAEGSDGTGVVDAVGPTALSGGQEGNIDEIEGVMLYELDVTNGDSEPGDGSTMIIDAPVQGQKLPDSVTAEIEAKLEELTEVKVIY